MGHLETRAMSGLSANFIGTTSQPSGRACRTNLPAELKLWFESRQSFPRRNTRSATHLRHRFGSAAIKGNP
jgi:hypothetical protein